MVRTQPGCHECWKCSGSLGPGITDRASSLSLREAKEKRRLFLLVRPSRILIRIFKSYGDYKGNLNKQVDSPGLPAVHDKHRAALELIV